ncbi:MAG: SurA N-terminal domain-containing protein [Rubritepida sp.]|jgi:peptidyl-prolyl cis-trans isomerase D|nr:SurA N-terminal domain-containing protein [Rubritepida sp.]MCU0944838.1 SurA N-terminal domain-containing protein [Rubritepida sp.]
MIIAMRRLASTWVAKALFVLLILSFAVWGIEDMLRGLGRDDAVARVDGEAIELAEAQEATRRELARITRALQGRFEPDARIRRAVAEQAVERLVLDRLVAREVARLGLAVPDEAVRDYVFQIQGFQGPDGRFSRELFQAFLRNSDISETAFLALLRADLLRQQLAGAVRAGAALPEALASPLLRWQLENRTVTLVELPFADAPEPPEPTEAQLARFHENNAARFSTPEFREVGVAVLNAERLIAGIEVSEREIEDAFAANRGRFETPERRRVLQALLPDEAAAAALAARWQADTAFADIQAAAREAGGSASDLGLSTLGDLPLPALAAAAFALAPDAVSAPVRSPFGWHVLRVAEIEPGTRRDYPEVREELRDEIAAERAADLAFDRANRIEDALAAREPLEEIARRYGMGYARVRLDAQGLQPDGDAAPLPVAAPARAAALRAIFQLDRNAETRLREGDWGFMAVQILDVTPPLLRPLAEVREAVREAFLADARRRHQETRAAQLLGAVRTGQTLAAAAEADNLEPEELGPFPREPGGGNPMPRDLLAPAFELAPAAATMVQRPQSFAVMQLIGATRPDLADQAEALAALRGEAAQAMADDLEAQLQAALRARADVRINPRLLDRVAGN